MENRISERNTVLGLTVISLLLLVGMTIMPAMTVLHSDIGLGFTTYGIADAAASGNLFSVVVGLVGWHVAIAFFAAAAATGPVSMLAVCGFL